MIGQPFAGLGSWHPGQHCGAIVPLAIPTPSHRIHATVNGFGDDVSLESVSDSYAGVILERVIDFGIVVYRIG